MRKEKTIQYFAYLSNSLLSFLGLLMESFFFYTITQRFIMPKMFSYYYRRRGGLYDLRYRNDNKVSSALVIFSVWRQFEITAQLAS